MRLGQNTVDGNTAVHSFAPQQSIRGKRSGNHGPPHTSLARQSPVGKMGEPKLPRIAPDP